MRIRPATAGDAPRYRQLRAQLLSESAFMLLEVDEYQPTEEQIAEELEAAAGRGNSLVLVAESGTELVGFLSLRGGRSQRVRHVGSLVMGVCKSHWRRGIGRQLLLQAIRWAVDAELKRLELTVAVDNLGAVRLYESVGFEIEGTKRRAVFAEGRFSDDYVMALMC